MTKEIELFIDTSSNVRTVVALTIGGIKTEMVKEKKVVTSQVLLPMIEALMKEKNITFKDLTGIRVHSGPGSYTGLRVGAAVANTLGWLLGVPVNGKRDEIAVPEYE